MRLPLLLLFCMAGAASAQDRPVIVADSYPVAYFAEQLAGDSADVRLVVPEGRDPSSWRPSLAEIGEIQSADLIVLNGAGLADWTSRAALPRARTVETTRGLTDRFIQTETITHSHGAEGSHSHEGVATHTWLDLEIAAAQAEALSVAIGRALPDIDVAANLQALADLLAALDAQGNALVDGDAVPTIASHPRYEYLGAAYDLEITSLDWEAGAEPNADQLAVLSELIAETGATLFIWEAAPPASANAAVADLGLAQAVVHPLTMPSGDMDFAQTMRANFAAIEEALR
ncbi:metal ABC transporter substrate-binding protein [Pontivivens insulae]|uniref:High-affinity zinc uptake system protein ZnuA n=1 Tax=Pontivivens insulae TaxID=1639689 RepID=A0A2R8A9H6_9RHOB|nr:metal ABC transporter substrate-binding protein [Pontivivens insulae]RED18780.1 zinc transport system substrate-binding protein [Pontivivens insulae]SPF28678.1 High-affinity zinc uptake system binding-protein ZnuA [Pontivivens insulae]